MPKSRSQFDVVSRQHFLFQGVPGTGKTTMALQFPKPGLIDIDNNLAGAIQGEALKGIDFVWDTPYEDADGSPIDPTKNPVEFEKRFRALFDEFYSDPNIETVILDSATAITTMFCNRIVKEKRAEKMEIQHWPLFIKYWIDMINIAKSVKGKRTILIAHEELVKDDLDGGMKRMLLLPSKARAIIPGMFPDVLEFFIDAKSVGGKPVSKHLIRCKGDNRVSGLKASHPAAKPIFDATWDEFQKILNQPSDG